jgi:hypothetical protein
MSTVPSRVETFVPGFGLEIHSTEELVSSSVVGIKPITARASVDRFVRAVIEEMMIPLTALFVIAGSAY